MKVYDRINELECLSHNSEAALCSQVQRIIQESANYQKITLFDLLVYT
jgi:hypothetical protein